MSHDESTPTLQGLINSASEIEKSILTAIAENDNKKVDISSPQFEELIAAILSFSTTTFSELKHKCEFGQKLILLNPNDSVIVRDIFSKLSHDIESLGDIYNA